MLNFLNSQYRYKICSYNQFLLRIIKIQINDSFFINDNKNIILNKRKKILFIIKITNYLTSLISFTAIF